MQEAIELLNISRSVSCCQQGAQQPVVLQAAAIITTVTKNDHL